MISSGLGFAVGLLITGYGSITVIVYSAVLVNELSTSLCAIIVSVCSPISVNVNTVPGFAVSYDHTRLLPSIRNSVSATWSRITLT